MGHYYCVASDVCILALLLLLSTERTVLAHLLRALDSHELASGKLSFLAVGDWGQRGFNQSTVAASMAASAMSYNSSFIVSLGDNFYESGVSDIYDEQWNSTFENVYTQQSLMVPWLAILGNHDYRLNPDAQVEYYKTHRDKRWVMPGRYYSKEFSFPRNTDRTASIIDNSALVTVLIVFIDTNILSPLSLPETSPGGIHAVTEEQRQAHLDFVEATLASSKADWKFVAGHHPIWSICESGDNPYLMSSLLPLFKKYKVDAYLNGHDHCLEHLTVEGIEYVVSGGGGHFVGGYSLDPSYTASHGVKFSKLRNGYALFSVMSATITFNILDLNGEELYSYSFEKSTWADPVRAEQDPVLVIVELALVTLAVVVGFLVLGRWLVYIEGDVQLQHHHGRGTKDDMDDDGVISLGDIDSIGFGPFTAQQELSPMHNLPSVAMTISVSVTNGSLLGSGGGLIGSSGSSGSSSSPKMAKSGSTDRFGYQRAAQNAPTAEENENSPPRPGRIIR